MGEPAGATRSNLQNGIHGQAAFPPIGGQIGRGRITKTVPDATLKTAVQFPKTFIPPRRALWKM